MDKAKNDAQAKKNEQLQSQKAKEVADFNANNLAPKILNQVSNSSLL